jgi:hypothetical protein
MSNSTPRPAYELDLPTGRKVVLVELTAGEMRKAMQLAGNDKNPDARAFGQTLEGLRMSVRSVDERSVSYMDLQGDKWDDFFSMRETTTLSQVFGRLHTGEEGEADAVVGNLRAVASGA